MALINLPSIKALPHHKKDEICASRAKYRDGRRDTAVKVYTINQESVYLLIQGVPAVGAKDDLQALCEQYGEIDLMQPLDEYPCEEFTEVYVVKYHWFPAARTAKKHIDDKSFFGGTLHVCYAPEFETVSDTRRKLQERRKYVAWKTKSDTGPKNENLHKSTESKINEISCAKKEVDNKISNNNNFAATEPVTYIWAGKEYTVYPQSSGSSSTEQPNDSPASGHALDVQQTNNTSQLFLPRQLRPAVQKTSEVASSGFVGSAFNSNRNHNTENTAVTSVASGTANSSSAENCYSSSIESIKKKLLHVAVPNVRASFKRRKMI